MKYEDMLRALSGYTISVNEYNHPNHYSILVDGVVFVSVLADIHWIYDGKKTLHPKRKDVIQLIKDIADTINNRTG